MADPLPDVIKAPGLQGEERQMALSILSRVVANLLQDEGNGHKDARERSRKIDLRRLEQSLVMIVTAEVHKVFGVHEKAPQNGTTSLTNVERDILLRLPARTFKPLQLLRQFTWETVPLTDQIFIDIVSYLNMVFGGAPKPLVVEDMKEAKEYHRTIPGSKNCSWWQGRRFSRWQRTICKDFQPLWNLLMAIPEPSLKTFNQTIEELSNTEYLDSWYYSDPRRTHRSDLTAPGNASNVSLRILGNSITEMSDCKSLKTICQALKRTYILARTKSTIYEASRRRPTSLSKTKKPTTPTLPFRLLDLPAEIRASILESALLPRYTCHSPYQRYNGYLPFWYYTSTLRNTQSGLQAKVLDVQILRTCKQLLREGLPILYGKNTLRLTGTSGPSYGGYQDFSEDILSRIGEHSFSMMRSLWLPGDPSPYPRSLAHFWNRNHMSLDRLLTKHSHLCRVKLLAFDVRLVDDYFLQDWRPGSHLYDLLRGHPNFLKVARAWRHRMPQQGGLATKELMPMVQQVNRSIFTSMVLQTVTTFRFYCGDGVFLYEAGTSRVRQLLISRDTLPIQFSKRRPSIHSAWPNENGRNEDIGPLPLRVHIGRRLIQYTTQGNNVIVC